MAKYATKITVQGTCAKVKKTKESLESLEAEGKLNGSQKKSLSSIILQFNQFPQERKKCSRLHKEFMDFLGECALISRHLFMLCALGLPKRDVRGLNSPQKMQLLNHLKSDDFFSPIIDAAAAENGVPGKGLVEVICEI